MKSEDLLKAIGNIDDKFIEEAAPKINAVNETNTAESNDSAKTDDKKLVEVVKVKPRNTFRIVASIAACVCLAAAVSFAIIGSTKFRPQTSDDKTNSNTDSQETKKSSVIEITDEESYVANSDDFSENEESIPWEQMPNKDKYHVLYMGDDTYFNARMEAAADTIEKKVGTGKVDSIYSGKSMESTGTVYKIKSISEEFSVAVQFEGDKRYYIYYSNGHYVPGTLENLINDLNLEDNMKFGDVYIYQDGKYFCDFLHKGESDDSKPRHYTGVSAKDIWDILLSNRDEIYWMDLTSGVGPFFRDYITIAEIEVNCPIIGYNDVGMCITSNGYLAINLTVNPGFVKLSDEQIQKFLDLFGNEYNYKEISASIESKYASENSKNNTSSVEASSSESSNSAELSNTDIPDNYFCAGSKKITSSDVKAIKAGMTYKEIINQLGETANFGQGNIRQYIVDDKLVLPLRFDSLSDVCKKTGEELLKQAIPYKVPERIKDKLNDDIYAVVINDKFISCINGEPDNCCTIDLSDAEIKFENGKTATAADIKPMSSVLISYDMVAESYPGSMHCLKVTILDSNS